MNRRASCDLAKRLDCGVFSTALGLVEIESAAKVGALQTLSRPLTVPMQWPPIENAGAGS